MKVINKEIDHFRDRQDYFIRDENVREDSEVFS